VTLAPIAEKNRRPEEVLMAELHRALPMLLGAILDAVVAGLKQLPSVELDALPRMADFAMWAEAIWRGIGHSPGEFLEIYRVSRKAASIAILEDSPIADPIMRMIRAEPGHRWNGTCKELLEKLSGIAGEKAAQSRRWPKTPHGVSGALRRLAPSLREHGVVIEFPSKTDKTRTHAIQEVEEDRKQTPETPTTPKPSKTEDETSGVSKIQTPDQRPANAQQTPNRPANAQQTPNKRPSHNSNGSPGLSEISGIQGVSGVYPPSSAGGTSKPAREVFEL
jgi:hypothetical protein